MLLSLTVHRIADANANGAFPLQRALLQSVVRLGHFFLYIQRAACLAHRLRRLALVAVVASPGDTEEGGESGQGGEEEEADTVTHLQKLGERRAGGNSWILTV